MKGLVEAAMHAEGGGGVELLLLQKCIENVSLALKSEPGDLWCCKFFKFQKKLLLAPPHHDSLSRAKKFDWRERGSRNKCQKFLSHQVFKIGLLGVWLSQRTLSGIQRKIVEIKI